MRAVGSPAVRVNRAAFSDDCMRLLVGRGQHQRQEMSHSRVRWSDLRFGVTKATTRRNNLVPILFIFHSFIPFPRPPSVDCRPDVAPVQLVPPSDEAPLSSQKSMKI
jgi:hypothetical protein